MSNEINNKANELLAMASIPYLNAYEGIMDESKQPYVVSHKSPLYKKVKKGRSKNKMAKQSRKKNRR